MPRWAGLSVPCAGNNGCGAGRVRVCALCRVRWVASPRPPGWDNLLPGCWECHLTDFPCEQELCSCALTLGAGEHREAAGVSQVQQINRAQSPWGLVAWRSVLWGHFLRSWADFPGEEQQDCIPFAGQLSWGWEPCQEPGGYITQNPAYLGPFWAPSAWPWGWCDSHLSLGKSDAEI